MSSAKMPNIGDRNIRAKELPTMSIKRFKRREALLLPSTWRTSVSRIRPPSALTTRSKAGSACTFGALCRTSISKKLLRERSDRFRSWHKTRRNAGSGRGFATLPKVSSETVSSLPSSLAFFDSVLIVASSTLDNRGMGSLRSGQETFLWAGTLQRVHPANRVQIELARDQARQHRYRYHRPAVAIRFC